MPLMCAPRSTTSSPPTRSRVGKKAMQKSFAEHRPGPGAPPRGRRATLVSFSGDGGEDARSSTVNFLAHLICSTTRPPVSHPGLAGGTPRASSWWLGPCRKAQLARRGSAVALADELGTNRCGNFPGDHAGFGGSFPSSVCVLHERPPHLEPARTVIICRHRLKLAAGPTTGRLEQTGSKGEVVDERVESWILHHGTRHDFTGRCGRGGDQDCTRTSARPLRVGEVVSRDIQMDEGGAIT